MAKIKKSIADTKKVTSLYITNGQIKWLKAEAKRQHLSGMSQLIGRWVNSNIKRTAAKK